VEFVSYLRGWVSEINGDFIATTLDYMFNSSDIDFSGEEPEDIEYGERFTIFCSTQ